MATGRSGCYIPLFMEEEIKRTMKEIGANQKKGRIKAMEVIVQRSRLGREIEFVQKHVGTIFQQKKKRDEVFFGI